MSKEEQLQASYRQSIYEEFGPLDAEVQLFKPKISRHEKLAREIRSWHEDLPAGQTFSIPAGKFTIQIGEKANKRRIRSMWKLYKALKLKLDVFLDRCDMKMAVIDALLPAEKHTGIIEETQSGPRPIKAVPNTETP